MKCFITKDYSAPVLDIDGATRTVKAVWSKMGNIDLDNDIIDFGAFTKTISERGPMGKNMIWSLGDHSANLKNVLGKPSELYVDGDNLIAVTKIVDTSFGIDVSKMYEAGLINQHSIGFSTIIKEKGENGTRTIKEVKLFEGSAVLWGANPETPTLGVKSLTPVTVVDRLEKLKYALKHGTYTDETFSLLEIEINFIQKQISELSTQAAAALEPPKDESQLEFFKQLNNILNS